MRTWSVVVVVLALPSGCSEPAGFDYTASVTWSAYEEPGILSLTIDGEPAANGALVERTFASFADAISVPVAVGVTTTTGSATFQLVPTQCGDACGQPGMPACDELSSEHDQWLVFHGVLNAAPADGPLEVAVDEGNCVLDGRAIMWETRLSAAPPR